MKSVVPYICVLIFICLSSESYLASSLVLEQARKFDEFGDVTCEDEMARLDNFALEVLNNPNSHAYIIVYGGRRGRRNEAKARAARMKFYLTQNRGLDRGRIVTFDGGYRDELTSELWLVERGARGPLPTSTVDPKDVRLRGRVKVRGYNCGAGLG